MTKIQRLLFLCLSFGAFLIAVNSCRKIDFERTKAEDIASIRARFLRTTSTTHPAVKAIAQSIERQDAARNFIPRLAKRAGFPLWDKAKVSGRPSPAARGQSSSDDQMLFIPFVRDSFATTNAQLIVKINATDTLYRLVYATRYKDLLDEGEAEQGQWGSNELFASFLYFDHYLFGHTEFDLNDRSIIGLPNDPALDKKLEILSVENSTIAARTYMETVCVTFRYIVDCPQARGEQSARAMSKPCTAEMTTCTIFSFDDFTDDDWIWFTQQTGGGGGGGGIPCETCTWENGEPCPEATNPGEPGTPATGFECEPGWLPALEPIRGGQPDTLRRTEYIQPAEFQGIRTYVTAGGTPFQLPANATIRVFQNIDPAVHPNGPVYGIGFGGKLYASVQQEYLAAGAVVVPHPEYKGFYEVDTTGRVLFGNKMPDSLIAHPPLTNGSLKVVRVKIVKDTSNNCQVVREIVDYTPPPEAPENLEFSATANYSLLGFDPAEGYTTDTIGIATCPNTANVRPPAASQQKTLTDYFLSSANTLKAFLQNRLHSEVDIYLYNCATNKVQYKINNTTSETIVGANQDALMNHFNQGQFGATDGHIAIGACVENGQWNFNWKFNYTRLGTLDPDIQNQLQVLEGILREHINQEVARIRNVGSTKETAYYPVTNGEQFFKSSMGLLETVSAFCDLAYHTFDEAKVPAYIWNQGRRADLVVEAEKLAYDKSVFKIPASLGGGLDQVIDEALGFKQMFDATLTFVRNPRESLDGVWSAIKNLDQNKVNAMLADMSGYNNYMAGGDLARYQSGRHTVMAATIFSAGVKLLTKGKDAIEKAGKEVTDVQEFVPNTTPNAVSDAIKDATTNGKLIKNIDNEKLLTRNIVNGEEHVVVIDRTGEIYSGKANYDIDGVDDNVLRSGHGDDIVDMHHDPHTNSEVKTNPQRWINGKAFEANINTDVTHPGKVQTASGVNLTGFEKVNQVQIRLPDGRYTVADNVWWKRVNDGAGGFKYEIVVNETKLSSNAPFTANQIDFENLVKTGNTNFTLRSKKFTDDGLPQNAQLEVKAYVKTIGDGTTGISNYTVTKVQ